MQTRARVRTLQIMWRMNEIRDMLCVITSKFVLIVVVQFWQGSTEHRKDPHSSHLHCFCITHRCNNDAATPASPPLLAMAPPSQGPLSALIITTPANSVCTRPCVTNMSLLLVVVAYAILERCLLGSNGGGRTNNTTTTTRGTAGNDGGGKGGGQGGGVGRWTAGGVEGGEKKKGKALIRDDDDDGKDVVIDGEVNGRKTPTCVEVKNWVRKMETSSLLVSD